VDGRPTGLLVVPGRGRGDPEPLDVQVVAAVRSTGREVVVSGAHAARIWGLPKPLSGWGRRVLLATAGPTRTTRELRIRVAPCVDGDVLRLPGGLLVTSPRRTVVDCLRTLAPPDALAVADAALRAGLAFDRFDVPQPQWQTDVHDADGFIGRADGWWRPGVVGESDGRAKYALATAQRGGVDAERLTAVLDAERTREQRLRRAGATVVRWGARASGPRRAEARAECRFEPAAGLGTVRTLSPRGRSRRDMS